MAQSAKKYSKCLKKILRCTKNRLSTNHISENYKILYYKVQTHPGLKKCDRILEKQPVSEKNKFFYCFVTFYREDAAVQI